MKSIGQKRAKKILKNLKRAQKGNETGEVSAICMQIAGAKKITSSHEKILNILKDIQNNSSSIETLAAQKNVMAQQHATKREKNERDDKPHRHDCAMSGLFA